ncbi:TraK domain-containing protein [Enterobacter asburiae]|uniref:TraK domain-containing protein n=1 Tax=Enterobacter asburiae TaxID=61645 RepID=UPI001F0815AF|nr:MULTISPECIES: type-F conjugative transfer system secretin TraK [Enterobacter]
MPDRKAGGIASGNRTKGEHHATVTGNPSKVVVDGELITSISGPTGAYDQSQTEDGALILSPLVGQNFTLFIQTDHGSSLSLNVRPQPGNGKTLRFTPMSPPLRKNDDAKAWEEGQTYEKTLVALSRAVVNGQVPDDYRECRSLIRHGYRRPC